MNPMLLLLTALCACLTACDSGSKPPPTAASQEKARQEVNTVTVKPAEHFNGKDGPESTGGPPTTGTNGQ